MIETTAPRKQRIFKNPVHQKQFDTLGYVLYDFLDAEGVARLKNVFLDIIGVERDTIDFTKHLSYYISVFDKDTSMKKAVDDEIKALFQDKVEELFIDYEILYCNFMAKRPGAGEIAVHQDNTFVDEDEYVAFNIWAPLEDTHPQNGCFHLIPGSHRVLDSYRAGSIRTNLTTYNETIKKYMAPFPLKAGSGILFDHKLFHYSPDNQSETWRPAAQLVVLPREAEPALAFYDEQHDPDHVALYKIDYEYLLENGLWSRPDGLELLAKKPYTPLPAIEDLTARLDRHLQTIYSA